MTYSSNRAIIIDSNGMYPIHKNLQSWEEYLTKCGIIYSDYSQKEGDKLGKAKKIIATFMLAVFISSLFPGRYYAQEVNVSESAAVSEQEKTQESQQVTNFTPVSKEASFGPYIGAASNKHAYEPFKEEIVNQEKQDLSYRKDRIIIKMEEPVSASGSYVNAASEVKKAGVLNLEPMFPKTNKLVASSTTSSRYQDNLSKWHVAKISEGTDVMQLIAKLKKIRGVAAVEPDYERKIEELDIPDITTDPSMGEQWYLDKLGIKEAREYLKGQNISPGGNRNIVVAVIDTGVDYKHEDLSANIWTNPGEIAGNRYDDDGNGFVDDIHGVSTVGDRYSGDKPEPMDDHGHGTHVAGIIAAQGNNGIGGVGVAYNVQVMPIKAAQSSGILTSSDIAQAIYYAVEKGADVINMSFGGYNRSTLEEDALQVAFGTSVLVAAAGNSGLPNRPYPIIGKDMYPAAYPWVLGVMAERQFPAQNGDNLTGFSNWDYIAQDSHEYEVMVPGEDIYSTLPGNKYAKWDGTSMAAPIVSGIAALVRSKFTDKDVYSSRFIMGQIASTGVSKQGITYNPKLPPTFHQEANAFNALSNTPKPSLSYVEHYLFDSKSISPQNDGDGVVDAGETIDIGMIIRNQWGKADNVQVKIDSLGSGGMSDPYATFIIDGVDYGAVGNFATDDNGFIYTNDAVTGVAHPFRIKIADDAPNDHVVPINITITGKNGFDLNDGSIYSSGDNISFMIRNGQELPGVITSNMTLTKDKYWIVPNATVIEKGARVTVEPGTQIQFWSSEPEDPYAEKPMVYMEVRGELQVNGTESEPVEMFASGLYPNYIIKIFGNNSYGKSTVNINYAKIMNPMINASKIDHCYFSQDSYGYLYQRVLSGGTVYTYSEAPSVSASEISNSKFYGLGAYGGSAGSMLNISGKSKGNLFDSCIYYMNEGYAKDNVYLKNYKLDEQNYGNRTYFVSKGEGFGYSTNDVNNIFQTSPPIRYNETGSTYFAVRSNVQFVNSYDLMERVEKFANKLGGHIVTINDEKENQFIRNNSYFFASQLSVYYNYFAIIGLNDFEKEGEYKWISGEEVTYNGWGDGSYNYMNNDKDVDFVTIDQSNRTNDVWYRLPNEYYPEYSFFIIEVPGTSYVEGIVLDSHNLTLGAGGAPAKLNATITPEKPANNKIKWTSTNPDVASVDENGVVTPLKIGNTTITVTTEDGGFTDACEITVIEIVPTTGVKLDKDNLILPVGAQETLIETVLPLGATDKYVTWSSSNNDVVSVDNKGKITGISIGSAVITVTTQDGGYKANCNVNVVQPVTGVSLEEGFLRLVAGETPTKLSAIIEPSNATIKDVKWRSSNTGVLTIDEKGGLTPVAPGTALVTVNTVDGNYTAKCIVTVWDHAVSFKTLKINGGYNHTAAINNDGTVWTWGNNDYGRLGDGTYTTRYSPIQVKDLTNIISIGTGSNYTVALKNDGTVWTWGYNGNGELGIGSYQSESNAPVQVRDLSNIVAIAAGSSHTVALKNDGTVWAWGSNGYGRLGDGTSTQRRYPVQVSNLTDVIAIAAGPEHTVAVKKDGTVWAWGYNYYGQLGNGTTNNSSVPVQVKNMSDVTAVSCGYYHTVALKSDGTVWAWGYGGHGQLGIGWQSTVDSPIQVQSISNIASIAAGHAHTVAVKNDGTVWTWGYNSSGQLGNGTNEPNNVPIQLSNISDVTSVNAGSEYTMAIKSDGTTWSWGYNYYGQLGDLTTNNSLVPTQTLFGILPDTGAPSIVSTDPVDNAINIATKPVIKITFNESITQGNDFGLVALKDSNNNIISLKQKSIDGTTLTIEPITELSPQTTYNLQIPENSIKDMFNNSYTTSYTLNFTIGSELTLSGYKKAPINKLQNSADSNVPTYAMPSPTIEEINVARIEFIQNGELSPIMNNVILNRWWDPDVSHWMRFTSGEGEQYKQLLSNNYWGTTNELLIGKAIVDYNDFRNMMEVIYKPYLTTPPETAYPFVTDVYVSTETQERATKVGAEKIKVNVSFNRDMDTNIQPQVSFGPDMPTTDYTVHAINGGWTDPRHWVGEFNITPITGDGYQFFRVAGAVAADDPWLVTGNDTERFRFEIVTSGTESLNLQAEGAEGKVILSWAQDDFDMLAGYNLYRSEDINGPYYKINSTVIPSDQKTFEDKNVLPGKVYFYKFTVVKTDFTESDYSNIAVAAPFDTIPPVINHNQVQSATVALPVQIYADVTDNVKVKNVYLFYRKTGGTDYIKKEMVKTTGDRYSINIEATAVQAPGIEYYIEATDGMSIARSGGADSPYNIVVTDSPKITSVTPAEGPEKGGTVVVISGFNFKPGAKVLFGTAPASSVSVQSENKITAVAPANPPSVVDVTVTNSDGFKDTLLRAFTYKKEGVEVSIPNAKANIGRTFEVPINIAGVSGLSAGDIRVTFDKDVLKVKSARVGNITSNFAIAANTSVAGQVTLTMASSAPVAGNGALAYIQFEVLNTTKTSSPLTLDLVKLNSGTIIANKVNGTFTLSTTFSISGSINYFFNNTVVKGVNMLLKGNKSYNSTNTEDGNYTINGVEEGSYVLTPSKADEAEGISAYDASLILQKAADLISLSGAQAVAADVDGSGSIDAMDASYVLQRAAGLINLPFQGKGKVWEFMPKERTYTNLSNDLIYQNFTAVLVGDVSGNWSSSGGILGANVAEFAVDTLRVEPSSTFQIPVMVNMGDSSLYGSEVVINYDNSLFTALSVEKAEKTSNFSIAYNLSTPGTIKVALAGAEPVKGIGALLNIKFSAKDVTGVTSPIQITKAEVNERGVPSALNNGKVIVSIKGDANLDNKVDETDFNLALQNYGQTNGEIDMNGDKKIDLYDLVTIGRRVKSSTAAKQSASAQSTANVELEVVDKAPSSDTFQVKINLKDVNNFYGGSFDMLFDPSVVKIVGITHGDIFASKKDMVKDAVYSFNNELGFLKYCRLLTTDDQGISGNGSFLTIHFKAIGSGEFKVENINNSFQEIAQNQSNARLMLSDSNALPVFYTANVVSMNIVIDNDAPIVIGTNPISNVPQVTETNPVDEAPTVMGTNPSVDANEVAVDSTIEVIFSEDITLMIKSDKKKLVSGVRLSDADGNMISVDVIANGNVLTVNPRANLKNNTKYTLTIPSGIVTDKSGNILRQQYELSFKTVE
jgi:alpha-tubulin suppressor-like RCC1 family protein